MQPEVRGELAEEEDQLGEPARVHVRAAGAYKHPRTDTGEKSGAGTTSGEGVGYSTKPRAGRKKKGFGQLFRRTYVRIPRQRRYQG